MHLLYSFIISPIEYIIEIIYVLMYKFLGNPGYALFGVSLSVSFLVLPLYLRADAIQDEESERQKEMSGWISHMKKNFHGDEQYMLLSAYYREKKYRPIYALRSTLSLLLQIPFFLAAYHYLSHLDILNGASFLFINDLGAEDRLIPIADGINLLPILMTVINMGSGFIYTKGRSVKEKLQVYLPAILFLFLLYHSPSGLVIYWTMNNIFSLMKNFVMKHVTNKKLFIKSILCFIGLVLLGYTLGRGVIGELLGRGDHESVLFFILFPLCLMLPLVIGFIPRKLLNIKSYLPADPSGFVESGVFLVSFLGLMIPLSVISSSAQDFINLYHYRSPLYYVLNSVCVFSGLLFLWGTVIFKMMNKTRQNIFSTALFSISMVALVNYFFLHADMGTCGTRINFEHEPYYVPSVRYGNVMVIIIVLGICIFLWTKFRPILRKFMLVLSFACIFMSGKMLIPAIQDIEEGKNLNDFRAETAEFHLSRTGKNVVVIMLDRALGAYTPFIMEERPELLEAFDGFVYYPNTVSTSLKTNHGSPALYGGYDYTAEALTRRSTEYMVDKHDQSLRIMPELFSENGFSGSVADVPFARYNDISDLSIYDDLDNINAFHYNERTVDPETVQYNHSLTERNLCFYSIFRCTPAMLQDNLYDKSLYLSLGKGGNFYDDKFMTSYMGLKKLSDYTFIDDSGDRLMIYCNCLTHEPYKLDPENYELSTQYHMQLPDEYLYRTIDGVDMDLSVENDFALTHYQVNAAAYILLAKWFEYLKEEGVYDNTRIILVADHGISGATGQFTSMEFDVDGDDVDAQCADALLMVKDFNAKGFSVNEQFMTNADVPALAMNGIIENPVNPYTGNPIDTTGKENGVNIFWSGYFETDEEFVPLMIDDPWYHVENDFRVEDNWSKAASPLAEQ